MRLKLYAVTSLFVLGLAAGVPGHVTYAADMVSEDTIILAQNGDDKPGFFGRLFNRSGEQSDARPLFLNKGAKTSGAKVQPYNFGKDHYGAEQGRSSSSYDSEWAAFEAVRDRQMEENTAFALAVADRMLEESDRMMRQHEEAHAGETKAGDVDRENSKKRMVYDPQKVWTYDPNKRDEPDGSQPARIYNSTR